MRLQKTIMCAKSIVCEWKGLEFGQLQLHLPFSRSLRSTQVLERGHLLMYEFYPSKFISSCSQFTNTEPVIIISFIVDVFDA
jgi:hypothetical protein